MNDRDKKPAGSEPNEKDGAVLRDRQAEWFELLKRLEPFPGPKILSTDAELPPDSIYSVFTLLVADIPAFEAVFANGEFNGHALFERYAGVLDSNLEQFVGVLAGHRAEMEAAQKVWRLLAGNYTGSACPDRTALTALTRFMNDGFKCPPREG